MTDPTTLSRTGDRQPAPLEEWQAEREAAPAPHWPAVLLILGLVIGPAALLWLAL